MSNRHYPIVNPCASSNLDNAARHAANHLADSIDRKNKYQDSFSVAYSVAISTRGEAGPDTQAPSKESAVRRANNWKIRSDQTWFLIARLRRRLFRFKTGPVIPHSSSSLQTGGDAYMQPATPDARPGACASMLCRGENQAGNGEWSGDRSADGDGNGEGCLESCLFLSVCCTSSDNAFS